MATIRIQLEFTVDDADEAEHIVTQHVVLGEATGKLKKFRWSGQPGVKAFRARVAGIAERLAEVRHVKRGPIPISKLGD